MEAKGGRDRSASFVRVQPERKDEDGKRTNEMNEILERGDELVFDVVGRDGH